MLVGGRSANADREITGGLDLGIGGVRTGGTAGFLAGDVGVAVQSDIVIGGRADAACSGSIDLAFQPEHVHVGFLGPSITWIGDGVFVGGAVGLAVFDAGSVAWRVGVELRAGAVARFGSHTIVFSVESVTPIQATPVPAIAVLVGYHL